MIKHVYADTRIEFAEIDNDTGKPIPGRNGWVTTIYGPERTPLSWEITWRGRTRRFTEGEVFLEIPMDNIDIARFTWSSVVDSTIEHEKLKESDPELWAACEAMGPEKFSCAEARA